MPLAAGQLRKRLRLQRFEGGRTPHGGTHQEYGDVAVLWAHVEPLVGKELERARSVEASVTHRVTIRPYPGITARDRFLLGERCLNILSVRNVDELDEQHEIMCEEVVGK